VVAEVLAAWAPSGAVFAIAFAGVRVGAVVFFAHNPPAASTLDQFLAS
jgi:hypothetical protein